MSSLQQLLKGQDYQYENENKQDQDSLLEKLEAAQSELFDKNSRLKVAQQQLGEFAKQIEYSLKQVIAETQNVQDNFSKGENGNKTNGSIQQDKLQQQWFNQIEKKLADIYNESVSYVDIKQDLEKLKRNSETANLSEENLEQKRLKEKDEEDVHMDDEQANEIDLDIDLSHRQAYFDRDSDSHQNPANSFSNNMHPPNNSAQVDYTDTATYIPVRLNMKERRWLRLLEATLQVSEYTDKVDIISMRTKTSRVNEQIRDICAILSGLVVAQNYKQGQQLVQDHNFAQNQQFFQDIFEVGRRHKIMNPEKMRSDYGKLMYMLMDSSDSLVEEMLEFKCIKPLSTVRNLLENAGAQQLLQDPFIVTATGEIVAGERPRYEVQRDIKRKEKAREILVKKYANSKISGDEILSCLYSLADHSTYLFFNRDPVDKMIYLLSNNFDPNNADSQFPLSISSGLKGARLSHSHEKHYQYVLQSLTLWREIQQDMFKLWYLAEQDMLNESNQYRLQDTGQGLNRVQQASSVGKQMNTILRRCQTQVGKWVGSSVVHLGDRNVPNALMFIDKYTQVPRILNPIILVLDELPRLYSREKSVRLYVDDIFRNIDNCIKLILSDFFKHAFDGSGADNFYDAGSCIDGRLTSAWNWCNSIQKKPYYLLFKMAGFSGFDGEFQK